MDLSINYQAFATSSDVRIPAPRHLHPSKLIGSVCVSSSGMFFFGSWFTCCSSGPPILGHRQVFLALCLRHKQGSMEAILQCVNHFPTLCFTSPQLCHRLILLHPLLTLSLQSETDPTFPHPVFPQISTTFSVSSLNTTLVFSL